MVFEKLRSLLAEQLGIEESQITPETDILDDLGADSLDIVEVMMGLEETYNLVIVDEAVHELRTVSDVVDFIEGMLDQQ